MEVHTEGVEELPPEQLQPEEGPEQFERQPVTLKGGL